MQNRYHFVGILRYLTVLFNSNEPMLSALHFPLFWRKIWINENFYLILINEMNTINKD